jgi:hypothetical protein
MIDEPDLRYRQTPGRELPRLSCHTGQVVAVFRGALVLSLYGTKQGFFDGTKCHFRNAQRCAFQSCRTGQWH